jgi:hypothetical protein
MSSELNKNMKLTGKMKKIDGLVSQLEQEVEKICVDKKCQLAPKVIKKSKNKNSKVITNS